GRVLRVARGVGRRRGGPRRAGSSFATAERPAARGLHCTGLRVVARAWGIEPRAVGAPAGSGRFRARGGALQARRDDGAGRRARVTREIEADTALLPLLVRATTHDEAAIRTHARAALARLEPTPHYVHVLRDHPDALDVSSALDDEDLSRWRRLGLLAHME